MRFKAIHALIRIIGNRKITDGTGDPLFFQTREKGTLDYHLSN